MDDLISRQSVKEWLEKWEGYIDQDTIARMQYRVIDIPSAQPDVARDIATIIENEKDMRVILEQPEQRWIPCSERLPEDDVEVFIYLFDGQSPYIAWVCDCHWYTEDFEVEKENYPTAWMPLPDPAKLESE